MADVCYRPYTITKKQGKKEKVRRNSFLREDKRDQSRVSPRGIYGRQSGNGKDFTPKTLVLKKVKCTLLQALRLCTGSTAYRGSRGIALPFHDHGTRRG